MVHRQEEDITVISYWEALAVSLVSGLAAGILAPLVTAWLHRKAWEREKHLDWQYKVFRDAVRALGLLEADALDAALQSTKPVYKDRQPVTNLRPATSELMASTRGMVSAFFTQETSDVYDQAQRARISIEEVPNLDFEAARRTAVVAMSKELGIIHRVPGRGWQFLRRFKKDFR
jgi:hypothetical protein